MKSISILIIALIVAVVVPHVCAGNVTYSQEYYTIGEHIKHVFESVMSDPYLKNNVDFVRDMELHRQTILLEKQNELISEQNILLKSTINMHFYCVMDDPGSYRPYNCTPIYT
jgi:hypothetical protein